MTEYQRHYLQELFYGIDVNDRSFIIKDLEDYLTPYQIKECFSIAQQSFSILSDMDKRFLSGDLTIDLSTYRYANLDYSYFNQLLGQLNEYSSMLFIASLEINFNRDMLDQLKKIAEDKTLKSLEIDRLLAAERSK